MPALACRECSIDYPNEAAHSKCPGCGEPTVLHASVTPDADWKKSALLRKSEPIPESEEAQRVVNWRRRYMRKLGYEYATACLVSRSDADVHFIEALIARGASREDALRIAC